VIPDYQALMRPVLRSCIGGEVRLRDVVERVADELGLTDEERAELLPSRRAPLFYNRVAWAKTYLQQAGLVKATRRGHFVITERGRHALAAPHVELNKAYLDQFEEFREFASRSKATDASDLSDVQPTNEAPTPDDVLRKAHDQINQALAAELLDRVLGSSPAFFERLIVELLIAMGYGGTSDQAGRAIGRSGDGGVDGVIDQDPLGVDQIYVQAKRYAAGNNVGAREIRDFYGALSLKKAQKGIYVTTSEFSSSAIQTANDLGSRIVLINGEHLARLLIRYSVGCREEESLSLKRVDEDFFESDVAV
jgi:restriction system protein